MHTAVKSLRESGWVICYAHELWIQENPLRSHCNGAGWRWAGQVIDAGRKTCTLHAIASNSADRRFPKELQSPKERTHRVHCARKVSGQTELERPLWKSVNTETGYGWRVHGRSHLIDGLALSRRCSDAMAIAPRLIGI